MPNAPRDPGHRLRPGAQAALFVLLSLLVVPILAVRTWMALRLPGLPIEWVEGGLVLLVSYLLLRVEGRPLRSLGLAMDRRWALEFGFGTALGAALITAAALVAWVSGACRFQWVLEGASGRMLAGAWLYLAVAFNEELIFRGFGLQRAVEALGPWPGQLLFALLFAYAHWGNPGMQGATLVWATLNIFLAGLLFGVVWMRTGSLAGPMGLHLGWNWMQGSFLGFGVSGGESQGLLRPIFTERPLWLSGGSFGLEAGLPCTVLCLLLIFLTIRWNPTRGGATEEVA